MTKKQEVQERYINLISEATYTEKAIHEKLLKEFSCKEDFIKKAITKDIKEKAEELKKEKFKQHLKKNLEGNIRSLIQNVYPPETLKEQVDAIEKFYKILKQLDEDKDKDQNKIEIKASLTYEDVKNTEDVLKQIFEKMVKENESG